MSEVNANPAPSPLGELLRLAGPTMAQMASYTVMQFLDAWMLARAVGTAAPAAASNAGGLAFSFLSFGIGTIMVVNTLASQSYGQRNYSQCGRHLWQGVWFSLAYALAMLPLLWVVPGWFAAFGHEPDMVAMEGTYFRIMVWASVFKLVHSSFSQFMLATNRPNLVLLSSILGVAVNAAFAYVVLFGKFGVTPMGVRGAAVAQALGMAVEMVTLICFATWRRSSRKQFGTLDFRFRRPEMRTLLRVGFGSGLQFIVEVLAWTMFANVVFGQLGRVAMEANAFMFRYLVCTFLPALGISSAVTALVGRYIGMGRPDVAAQRADLGFKVAAVYLLATGLVYFLFRRELIEVFTHEPEVVRLGALLMIFA
ncbi:MAG: MATE family efflux transporter, partial [Tepidisphaeraceae bacterium]